MNIFEDSINLLKGAAFTNIKVTESYLFLESPAILSEYIVPLTFLNQFNSQEAHDLFLNEQDQGKNISYYLRSTLLDDYKDYFNKLRITEDYVDSYMLKLLENKEQIENNDTILEEVNDSNFEEYKLNALEIFNTWSNEEDYVSYFNQLSKSSSNGEEKFYKDYVLTLNKSIVSIGSVIFDIDMNLAYVHNAGTVTDYRRNGYFYILNKCIINKALEYGINRIYSITEKDSDSFNAYTKLGFKEVDHYYSFS